MKDLGTIGLIGIGIFFFGGVAYFSREDLVKQMEVTRNLKAISADQDVKTAKMEIVRAGVLQQTEAAKESAPYEQEAVRIASETAKFRYMNNCRVPQDDKGRGIALKEGLRIEDATGRTLQSGIYVCDSLGGTGVIGMDGTVAGYARLSDTPKAVLPRKTFEQYFKEVAPSKVK